jgi:hypothetical protein
MNTITPIITGIKTGPCRLRNPVIKTKLLFPYRFVMELTFGDFVGKNDMTSNYLKYLI